jgi:hypothetical protein
MSELQYQCRVCEKQVMAEEEQPVPLCCGKEMEPMGPLPFCRVMPDPEQARNYEEDGPCADGTTPKKR